VTKLVLPPKKIALFIAVLAAVFPLLIYSLWLFYSDININFQVKLIDLFFWGALIAWAQLTEVKLPFSASFSHSYLFTLSAVMLFPPWIAPLLVFIFFFSSGYKDPEYAWYKDLFNRLQTGITVATAAAAYWFIMQNLPVSISGVDVSLAAAIVVASTVSFIVNVSLVSMVVHLSTNLPFRDIWFHNFGWVLVIPHPPLLRPFPLVPDAILFKPGSLTDEEFAVIKKHPEYGVRLLEPAQDYLRETFDIIKYHHERWDGRGYPEGLAGQEIPLWARIVGLADAYEAMTAGRPYQKAKTPSLESSSPSSSEREPETSQPSS